MLTNEKNVVEKPVIDIEDKIVLHAGNVYAITVNPDDTHQYNGVQDRMKLFKDYVNALFLCLPQYGIDYKLYIEISECLINNERNNKRPFPRLHVHGFILFSSHDSIKSWLLFHSYRIGKHNDMMIKVIVDEQWTSYCTKQQDTINEAPIESVADIYSKVNKPDVKTVCLTRIKGSRGKPKIEKILTKYDDKIEIEKLEHIYDDMPDVDPNWQIKYPKQLNS